MSTRSTIFTIFLVIALLVSTFTLIILKSNHYAELSPLLRPTPTEQPHKVPLEIHIMSKCPDAKDCLEDLISPSMDEISNLVNFRISFIGRPAEAGVSCLHGPSECLSNTIHLCASHIYPVSISLPFSLCLTHNYTLLPQQGFIESCATDHSVNFTKLNECISDIGPRGGMNLLTKSVQRSRRVGAEVSCTVRVDKKKWCIRDGGEWKECKDGAEPQDLVDHVKELYREKNGQKRMGLVRQGGEYVGRREMEAF